MSDPVSAHVLVVADEYDEDGGGLEILHPPDCPRESSGAGYWFFTCVVGQMESDAGLDNDFAHRDDPDTFYRAERLAPGRYEVEPWFETHPGGPWGPTEYSAGLCRSGPVSPVADPGGAHLPEGEYQYGVMFQDGSVARRWNGCTQEQRARENLADCKRRYPNDNIRLVRRWIGQWEPTAPAPEAGESRG